MSLAKIAFGVELMKKHRECFIECYIYNNSLFYEKNILGTNKSVKKKLFTLQHPESDFPCFFKTEFLSKQTQTSQKRQNHVCYDRSFESKTNYFFLLFDEKERNLTIILNSQSETVYLFKESKEKECLRSKMTFIKKIFLGKKSGKGPMDTHEDIIETLQHDLSDTVNSDLTTQELPSTSKKNSLDSVNSQMVSLKSVKAKRPRMRRTHSSKELLTNQILKVPSEIESFEVEDLNTLKSELSRKRLERLNLDSWKSSFQNSLVESPKSASGLVTYPLASYFTIRNIFFENRMFTQLEILNFIFRKSSNSLIHNYQKCEAICRNYFEYFSFCEIPKCLTHIVDLSPNDFKIFLKNYSFLILNKNKALMKSTSEIHYLKKHLNPTDMRCSISNPSNRSKFGFDLFIKKVGLSNIMGEKLMDQSLITLECLLENNNLIEIEKNLHLPTWKMFKNLGVKKKHRVSAKYIAIENLKVIFSVLSEFESVRKKMNLLFQVLQMCNKVQYFQKSSDLLNELIGLLINIFSKLERNKIILFKKTISKLLKEFLLFLTIKGSKS